MQHVWGLILDNFLHFWLHFPWQNFWDHVIDMSQYFSQNFSIQEVGTVHWLSIVCPLRVNNILGVFALSLFQQFFFSEKHHGLHNHPVKKQQKLHFYIIEFLLVKDARVTASDTTITFVHRPTTVTAAAVGLFSELSNLRYWNIKGKWIALDVALPRLLISLDVAIIGLVIL